MALSVLLCLVWGWQGVATMDRQSLIEVRQHVEWWDDNFMINVRTGWHSIN